MNCRPVCFGAGIASYVFDFFFDFFSPIPHSHYGSLTILTVLQQCLQPVWMHSNPSVPTENGTKKIAVKNIPEPY